MRWGVLGPGWIAHRFVSALRAHTGQELRAVASRSTDRAERFAAEHAIGRFHGGYADLLADPEVDVVYVSTPHTEHHPCALAAIAAGKHVLVEKPIGINAVQAEELFAAARAAGVFVGEAMWTRFLPKFDVLQQILDSGVLGTVHTVMADHGEYFTTDHRIYDPALAGGPMLDLGTYPVAFAQWVLGPADDVAAIGQPANDSLNGQISAIIRHRRGGQSVLNTTILTDTPTTGSICGTDGLVSLPGPYYQPGPFTVTSRDGTTLQYEEEPGGHQGGLHFAAVDAARSIAAGSIESATHRWHDIASTLEAMDAIRGHVGISFPGE